MAVDDGGLGDLLTDLERRVERRGGALCEVGDVLAAHQTALFTFDGQHIGATQEGLAAGEKEPGLGVTQRRQRNGCLA